MNTQSQKNEFELNDLYRPKYHRTMKWLSFMIVVCAVLSVILSFMVFDKKQPLYYAAVTTGEVVPMHALSEPIVTNNFIMQWSALAARRVYNLSFDSYQNQLNQVKDKFTPEGWEKMMAAMKGMIKQITGSRLVMTSVVESSPVILARLIIHGRYTWRVQMKLLVTYTSASEQTQRHIIVTMNVQRVPTLDASQGIQIIDFSSGAVT
jgi:intracellular multiplication protein IcmL